MKRFLFTVISAGFCCLVALSARATDSAQGLDNPTLALNLSAATGYATGQPFLDLVKMAKPWFGRTKHSFKAMSLQDLRKGGHIDQKGWVKSIPEGLTSVSTLWAGIGSVEAAKARAGRYVLTYEGTGRLELGGAAHVVGSRPGRIVFNVGNGKKNFWLDIVQTDPKGTGDYIRNISIVKQRYVDLHAAGAVFNPEWLQLIADSRQIRFMDWTDTNGIQKLSWKGRTKVDGANLGKGVAIEDMVRLANEIGADPWFCMPGRASEDYMRAFATYVRDHLDPALTVRVEYSNETWNFAFGITSWLYKQSKAEWGKNAPIDYSVMMAVRAARVWEEVFADEPHRLINVLGSQATNPWLTKRSLDPVVWRANNPEGYVDPATVFEELAITSYFGNKTVGNEKLRAQFLKKLGQDGGDPAHWLAGKLMDPAYKGSIPWYRELWAQHAEQAHRAGLGLIAYEGGQHVHQSFRVKGVSNADLKRLTEFMTEFVRSAEMGALYEAGWEAWVSVSDGPYMQFNDVGAPSKWGSWGLYAYPGDSTPRSVAFERLNRSTRPWWEGAEGGGHYQHGVTVKGGDTSDRLIGTFQEDYLLGGKGDDILIPGRGDDGLNGGPGVDRVVLSGLAAEYSATDEGEGYRLTGPEGTDFLINVELLVFDDGTEMAPEAVRVPQ